MPTDAGAAEGAAARAGAILTVDLAALRANYARLRQELAGVPCAAVVKADAYGLGLEQAAPALWRAGARSFFVALPDEGLRLRALLPEAEVYVLGGLFRGAEADYLARDLRPVLNSLEEVGRWALAAREAGRTLPAALQLDSGMARLGLPDEEIDLLAAEPGRLAGIELRLLLSHLASAEDPEHPLNREQLERFRAARARLPAMPASLANSSGLFLGPDFHFDLGRPGAALYGVNPQPGQPSPMRQVVRLQAKVLQVRAIDRGRSVGYGAAFRAERPTRIATLALGYADGFLRSISDRGWAWAGGQRLPLAGRVSMDLVTLDVGALPPERLRPGDLVDLLGPEQGVDDLAQQAGTIGYEILTALGRRYHRAYRDA